MLWVAFKMPDLVGLKCVYWLRYVDTGPSEHWGNLDTIGIAMKSSTLYNKYNLEGRVSPNADGL